MRGRAVSTTRVRNPIDPDDSFFWLKLFFRIFMPLLRLIWRNKVTIIYLTLTVVFFTRSTALGIFWLIATVVVPATILALDKANIAMPGIVYQLQQVLSSGYTHDWKKRKFAKEQGQAIEDGLELLRQIGVISYGDENIYDVALIKQPDFDTLVLGQMAVSPIQIHKLLSEYLTVLGYNGLTLLQPENGYQSIKLLKTDPLDVSWEIKDVQDVEVDFEKATVGAALNESGDIETISFKNISAVLVGGMSGSGKSLSMMAGLFPYLYRGAQAGKTQLYLADGKGGFDWQFCAPLAMNENPADVELDEMVELTDELVREMNRRYEILKNLEITNGWGGQLSRTEMPHLVFLIDECQNYFDSTGLDKEDKGKVQQIIGNVTRLVKKARAVAMTVVLMTQKSDTTAIPSAIRDIAQLRISLRQPTRLNSSMILGEIPDDLPVSPEQLPAGKPGIAIMMNERSEYVKVRFGFITDETIKLWKTKAQGLNLTRAES